jgi:hypothetical protein
MQPTKDYCFLCSLLEADGSRRNDLEEHHVIYGRANRKLSEKYGLMIDLCRRHHREGAKAVHITKAIRRTTEAIAQKKFAEVFPDEDYVKIFGKNYL